MNRLQLAVFASGSGTNALNIYQHFRKHPHIGLNKIFVNKPSAGVIARAIEFDIPYHIFSQQELDNGQLLKKLQYDRIDAIALAGFLKKIPSDLIAAYQGKIFNIHPSLLPKYGGKGMYGKKVHEAVLAAGETQSGISIHQVNSHYDEGDLIFQQHLRIDQNETPDSLAKRIHLLEYEHYPHVLEKELLRIFA